MTQNRTLVPKSTRSLVLVLVLVASLFLFVGTAAAQGGTCPSSATTLRLGDSSTGNITNSDYADFYCFNANAGEVVVIDLVATSGNLDTLIVVSDVDLTTMLGRDDDGGDGLNSHLEFRAPETGIYLLSVTRFNIADGTSTGSYRVTISGSGSGPAPQATRTPLPPPTTAPSPDGGGERLDPEELCPSSATVIDFEEVETFSNTGQITSDDFADFYCFIGYEGDVFEIDLQATSGNLDTFIVISDPDFETMVASDDDGGEGLNSFLELEIEETAPYMLSVTRFNVANGTSSGSYSVSVTLTDRPNGPGGGGGGDCVGGVDLDDPISILTASTWYADFGNDTEVTVTFEADGTVTFTLGDITTTTEFTVSGGDITFPLGQSVYEIREVSPTAMALGTAGNASIEFEPLDPIVAGGDCPDEPVNGGGGDTGDCDSGPLGQLVFGEWRIIGNDALEFDFQCDGVLIITNDGSPSTVSYTFDGSTIELQVGSETIVWTDVILTDSALIVTVESSGNTLFLANTEAE